MAGKNNPSLSARRNLWRSKTEENKYSRDLRNIIAEYGDEIQAALLRSAHTGVDGTQSIDINAFSAELERIETTILNTKGADVTSRHAKDGMVLGLRYADRTLKDEGIDDTQS